MKTPEELGLKDVVLHVKKTDEVMKRGYTFTFSSRNSGAQEPLTIVVHEVEVAKLAHWLEELIGSRDNERHIEGVYIKYGTL